MRLEPITTPPEDPPSSGQAAVYRFYDAAGELLYIGSTGDPAVRWATHRRDSPWWPQVASWSIEWLEHRVKAFDAESKAIWIEEPKFNQAGSRGYSPPRLLGPPRVATQRLAYLAYTGRRDACRSKEASATYKAVIADPSTLAKHLDERAGRIAAELIEDMQGLAWARRRRTVEKGRQLMIRRLRTEGLDDLDVAAVMAAVHCRITELSYLTEDDPHGRNGDHAGVAIYVAYAERGPSWWSGELPALGLNIPLVRTLSEVGDAARLAASKLTGLAYRDVVVRVRVGDPVE